MSMSSRFLKPRSFAVSMLAVAVPAALAVAAAVPGASAQSMQNEFHQTNLVSDLGTVGAQVVDPDLVNSWGLALGPTTPLWVADNGTSVATVYGVGAGGTTVQKRNLTVTLPPADSAPTGQVFNPTGKFVVRSNAGKGAALFIFSSESGHIIAWNPTADPIVNGKSTAQVEFSSRTAVYKGLAIGNVGRSTFLYASNFHDNRVDVFDGGFDRVRLFGNFRDGSLPPGYAPFGIQEINGLLYVSYALQDADKKDDVAGPGHGFIDVFTNEGLLVKRLVSRGDLNSPWGLTLAPAGFGPFGGKLLVGNFGDGLIHVYDPANGLPLGALLNEHQQPIQIDGLWGLLFGTATTGGTGTLLFSAGINDEADGLVGSITPVS
jgi:uncharacterized protein (TIGR03118 family)